MNESERIRKLGMTTFDLVKWAYPSIFNGHGFDRLYHLDVANALYVVCLDKNYRPMANPVPVHLGSRGGILIHPRDILKVPLRWGCDKIIVIMTATTGEDKTSKTAYIFGGESGTKYEAEVIARIGLAADTVGIKLLDWIHIRNDGAWYDWNRNGNMTGVSRPRVSADDDTSADLWDDPGTTDLSNEKSGRHALERKWGFGISESSSSTGTSTEDLTYERLVRSGQKSKAMILLRKHVGKMMPDTIVTDSDGLPKIVFHNGTFTSDGCFIPNTRHEGMHFGTKKASSDRKMSKLSSERRTSELVSAFEKNRRWFYVVDRDGPNEYDSYQNGSDGWNSESEALGAGEESFDLDSINTFDGEYGYHTLQFFLNVINPYHSEDRGEDWSKVTFDAIEHGYDGIEYTNKFEDVGSASYIALNPEQVKLADITYDDSGKLIPLSKRFDTTNPDVRY